jgi:hypothetical protein
MDLGDAGYRGLFSLLVAEVEVEPTRRVNFARF